MRPSGPNLLSAPLLKKNPYSTTKLHKRINWASAVKQTPCTSTVYSKGSDYNRNEFHFTFYKDVLIEEQATQFADFSDSL